MKYSFRIRQIIYKNIEIEASSEDDAREEVERMIGDGEIHFDDEAWLKMEIDIA